jgi:hypothetical protein
MLFNPPSHLVIGLISENNSTPISGRLELLFNGGCQEYKSFCMKISSFYDSIFSSNDTADVNVIPFDDDEVHVANDLSDDDINTLFMLNESVIFKH